MFCYITAKHLRQLVADFSVELTVRMAIVLAGDRGKTIHYPVFDMAMERKAAEITITEELLDV